MSNSSARKAVLSLTSQLRRKEISSDEYLDELCIYWDEVEDSTKHKVLLEALSLINDNAVALCDIGLMFGDLDDLENEIIALEKSLDIDAYFIESWEDLADCYFELEQFDKCLESCDFGIAVDPDNHILHYYRAFILFMHKQQSEEAIESFEICKKYYEEEYNPSFLSHPDDVEETRISTMYDLMAQCYAVLDRIDESIECYEKLIMREPKEHEILSDFSRVLLEKGDLPKALEIVNKAIKLSRRNVKYLAVKTSIQSTMHDYEGALETLDKIIKIRPKDPLYIMAKAALAVNLQKMDIADQEFRRALSLKPTDAISKNLLMDYFISIDDKEALKELKSY